MHLFDKTRNESERKHCDLDSVLSSWTVKQFDSSFTAQHFGYKDVDDYYRDAMLRGKIHQIKVPVLAISAEDDPFQVLVLLNMSKTIYFLDFCCFRFRFQVYGNVY